MQKAFQHEDSCSFIMNIKPSQCVKENCSCLEQKSLKQTKPAVYSVGDFINLFSNNPA